MESSNKAHPVTKWLANTNGVAFTIVVALAAFSLYTCAYAFRKTFAAATFDGMLYAGISYKAWLVIFQVCGYGLSKFIGIRIIAELKPKTRAIAILQMIGIAGLSWFLFAITPPPYNMIFLFTNGLPLGLIWGMVFSYLEGRRMTEVLGATLSVSFIFSSGLCRTVGALLLQLNVSQFWMPFVASCLFSLPLLFFVWLLDKTPPPTAEDEAQRTKRSPMDARERRQFLAEFLPGIILFVICYITLTIFRDLRDNFSAEVWQELGYGASPGIFTETEIPISLAILAIMSMLMMIRNNGIAFMVNHIIIAIGFITIGISTFLYEEQIINGVTWMICIGMGLYLGYVPFNSVFFDRMIATFRYVGTVGFIMYVADSFGYLGSVTVLIYKEFFLAKLSWSSVFINGGYLVAFAGFGLIAGSMVYFQTKRKVKRTLTDVPDPLGI